MLNSHPTRPWGWIAAVGGPTVGPAGRGTVAADAVDMDGMYAVAEVLVDHGLEPPAPRRGISSFDR
jgi:hypothetical protein